MNHNIFLGRQPILDRHRKTFGYELLYRDGPNPTTFFDDPDDASRIVMERALLHWGMERIIGDKFGFINAGTSLIKTGIHRGLPPEGIIFEISVGDNFDGTVIDAVKKARRDGYHFALDNVSSLEQLEEAPLLPFVSMVKIEAGRIPHEDLPLLVEYARSQAKGVLLVAEKVETLSLFDVCTEAGFDLFQGYFFAEPEILSKESRPTNSLSAARLMAEMQRGDIDIDRTAEIVATDPSLGFRILSVVNSCAFGLDRRVSSLHHAIVLLGVSQVRNLAMLLSLSGNVPGNEELIILGATRARLASRIERDPERRNSAFTVGLLSVTDAIFQTPMEELISELPVSDEVAEALVHGRGPLSWTLDIVRACENSDVELLAEYLPEGLEDLLESYGEALDWANEIRSQMPVDQRRSELPRPVLSTLASVDAPTTSTPTTPAPTIAPAAAPSAAPTPPPPPPPPAANDTPDAAPSMASSVA